jgi:hypothetical protein
MNLPSCCAAQEVASTTPVQVNGQLYPANMQINFPEVEFKHTGYEIKEHLGLTPLILAEYKRANRATPIVERPIEGKTRILTTLLTEVKENNQANPVVASVGDVKTEIKAEIKAEVKVEAKTEIFDDLDVKDVKLDAATEALVEQFMPSERKKRVANKRAKKKATRRSGYDDEYAGDGHDWGLEDYFDPPQPKTKWTPKKK